MSFCAQSPDSFGQVPSARRGRLLPGYNVKAILTLVLALIQVSGGLRELAAAPLLRVRREQPEINSD